MSGAEGVAYRSNAAQVLADWDAYQSYVDDVRARRKEFADRYGRNLMVNRIGFGHGTRVVGLEQLESDTDGDVFGENGEWRVPKVGPPYRTATPNIRRKAGKEVRDEIAGLSEEGPRLTGMPPFVLSGMHCLAPALMLHDGYVWARWADEIERGGTEVDGSLWERVPLSVYFAATEAVAS